ncbi:metal-dependent hydrolase family protein [Actinopolyspora saharensis]|uniref:Imidazolonepropionase n=1 Tax=Actinopolyspora saharensis TaxID=995062 RepID=A0A1H0YTQ7_9ACTN|nr:amidohydrolase family protein [Actinopolyspora saharensis]SDQ18553.1 Imidazolonepropionase [Actinopolyspora saharensis]
MQQLITADQVVPGPAGQRIADGAVLVDGDAITAVGPRAEVEPLADDARRHTAVGGTVLPGLVNAHVHLSWDAGFGMLERFRAADDAELLLGIAGRAQQALRAGVTTLRDLGDRDGLVLRVRDAIARGVLAGPRLLGSGPPLTPPQGHCWFFGGEVSGADQIRERIRGNVALGADVIKVMASGGEMTPDSPPTWQSQFSAEELALVVREAHAAGLPVAAHAHGTEAIAAAAAAGVDTIEHCSWQGADNVGSDLRDEVAREIAERGIAVCHAYPPDWRTFQRVVVGEQRSQAALDRLHWMDEHGVRFVPGTDGGLPTSVFDNYVGALSYYVDAVGWSPARVIDMATTGAARALGLERVGSLAAGHAADLLVVDGDPLADVTALHRQRLVLARGRAVTPDAAVG